jgi:hypothetical protein
MRTAIAAFLVVTSIQISTAAADGKKARDYLAQAQAAVESVDFPAARKLVAQAFETGGMAPGELARAHRFAGEIAAAVGDDESARDHFVRWILLDQQASLAPGVSPKISAAFDDARRDAAGLGALTVSARIERAAGKAVVLAEARDPVDMIVQLRVRTADGAEVVERSMRAVLPADDTRSFAATVSVLDKDGNEIWTDKIHTGPLLVGVDRRFPGWARWPTWTVLAGVAAGTGLYFGYRVGQAEDDLEALNADSAMHTYDEVKEVEDRGKRDALIANLTFGVAGAAAAAAVLTYVLEPKGVELVPAAAPDGASITARVRF